MMQLPLLKQIVEEQLIHGSTLLLNNRTSDEQKNTKEHCWNSVAQIGHGISARMTYDETTAWDTIIATTV
jgi:hypothetical protein